MAWRRPGDKPLSEPIMVKLLTHIYASLCLNELNDYIRNIRWEEFSKYPSDGNEQWGFFKNIFQKAKEKWFWGNLSIMSMEKEQKAKYTPRQKNN